MGEAELEVLDKKTLQRIQEIEKLSEDERKVIYKVLDSLLRDAKAKQADAQKIKPGDERVLHFS